MRVGLATVGRLPNDARVWSGTPAGIVGGMERSSALTPVLLPPPNTRLHLAGRALSFVTKRMPGDHKINWEIEPFIMRRLAKDFLRDGAAANTDVNIAVGWMPLCPPDTPGRTALWNDATYAQLVDSHPHWSHLGRRARRLLEKAEGAALRSVSTVLMSSRWAADDAQRRYGLDPARIHVVPLGANIATPPLLVRSQPDASRVRLLAIGVEWHRKGLDIAVETVGVLRRGGVEASLDVVGIGPPDESWRRAGVTYHGFLSKNVASEAEQLAALYRSADVLLFPSRDEPYGVVPCEAAAYALPVVATRISAIPEIVSDGETGTLVDPGSSPDAWAEAVVRTTDADYVARAHAARRAFETRLNWDACIARLAEVLA